MLFVQLQDAVSPSGTPSLRYPSALTHVLLKRNFNATVALPYGGRHYEHGNGTAAESLAANASQVCS
jgi:hypothetical protein